MSHMSDILRDSRTNILIISLFILIAAMLGCRSKELLWVETFDHANEAGQEIFWSEGNKAEIRDGRLYVDADSTGYRASTIWFDKIFTGDISVKFDVHVLSSSDHANNINFFFLYSDPSGESLRLSAGERQSGQYSLYHQLKGYLFTNVTTSHDENEMEVRYRFRDNPGFEIIDERFTKGEKRGGVTHQIKIVKKGSHFQYWIDGTLIFDLFDEKYNPVHDHGFLGLRTWHTSLWIDNLVVREY